MANDIPWNPLWEAAIAAQESGGAYDKLGPLTKKGDRAYGKYQVMGNNIPDWTQSVLGQAMTPQEFLNSPEAQDAVFRSKFGASVGKYGNPQDAASVWFSGRPVAAAGNASDVLGTTVPSYVARFNKFLGDVAANGMPSAAPSASSADTGATDFSAQSKTPAPSLLTDGIGGLFGLRNGKTAGGYDVANALGGAAAAMMALDNPQGAAVLQRQVDDDRKLSAAQAVGKFQYDPKSGTFYRTLPNGSIETRKNPNAPKDSDKPLAPKVMKDLSDNVEKYGTIAQISDEGAQVLDDLQSGKLQLGALRNMENAGRNMAGVSNEQSQAYARYKQFIQKLANTEMLKANGVQTEGDAFRVMQEIAAGGANYDTEAAKQAIMKLLERNKVAVMQNGRAIFDAYRGAYGDNEAFKPFVQQYDSFGKIYENIDKKVEGYNAAKPQSQSLGAKAPGGFRIINVR